MTTLSVGKFKSHFSEVLQMVQAGEKVGVAYGKKGIVVAVLTPPTLLDGDRGLKLGMLEGKARFNTTPDFKLTEDELVS